MFFGFPNCLMFALHVDRSLLVNEQELVLREIVASTIDANRDGFPLEVPWGIPCDVDRPVKVLGQGVDKARI
eukprot:3540107-Prorocentrum_lima.AAC.1